MDCKLDTPIADERWPSTANMVSQDDTDHVTKRHKEILSTFNATVEDCNLVNVKACESWNWGKTNYQLQINTYLGWKCYMLHTGCFASIPQYETAI